MACLQYNPKPIEYREKIYARQEIFSMLREMVKSLDDQGETFLPFDLASVMINVDPS